MKIEFNYVDKIIRIIDGSYDKSFHVRDSSVNGKVQHIFPLLILNYMLNEGGYPYEKEYSVDLIGELPYIVSKEKLKGRKNKELDIEDVVSRSISYLNTFVFADFEKIRIKPVKIHYEKKLPDGTRVTETITQYSFTEGINTITPLEWEITGQDLLEMKAYGIKSTWTSDYVDLPEIDSDDEFVAGNPGDIAYHEWEKDNGAQRHKDGKVKQTPLWNDEYIKKMAIKFSTDVLQIDNDLLPGGKCGSEDFDTLKDFVCSQYINEKLYNNARSFAIVEGGMGAGKTYSANSVSMELVKNDHISFTIPAYAIYSKSGTNSLQSYICRYMIGGEHLQDEQKLTILIDKQKKDEKHKLVILIDCIDEIYPGAYKRLADEINEISSMGHFETEIDGKIVERNAVYFILLTREAKTFLNNSGILGDTTYLQNCVNIQLNELNINKVAKSKEMKEIIEKFREDITPLFVSYIKEMLDINKALRSQKKSLKSLDFYGENIDLKQIRNYYDLFNTRAKMHRAHADMDNGNPEVFSKILPKLAYEIRNKGLSNKEDKEDRRFSIDEIAAIDAPSFEAMPAKRRAMVLTNTGVIRAVDDSYEFSHFGYMQFLAARYTADIYLGNEQIAQKKKDKTIEAANERLIQAAINETSFYTDEYKDSRIEKLRLMPYYYYLFMDIANRKGLDKFDKNLYRLGTNIGYEAQFDVWDEMKEIETQLITHYNKLLLSSKRERDKISKSEIEKYKDWKLINSTNAFLYTVISQRKGDKNRWDLLTRIYKDLCVCAASVMFDVYYAFGMGDEYEKVRTGAIINADFCRTLIDGLLIKMETNRPDYDKWKYPIDLIGRIYSNIGAVYQAMAIFAHKNSANMQLPESYDKLLKKAVLFHGKAKEYRIKTASYLDKETRRTEISLIRSDITIATDLFYLGLYEEDVDTSQSYFDQAISVYHDALAKQGYDFTDAKKYTLDMALPIPRKEEFDEEPHVGSEPYTIWLRIGGCQNLKYIRTKSLNDTTTREYAEEQFDSLRAAYLFVLQDCVEDYEEKKLDSVKLELATPEIDAIWRDTSGKYIDSFSDLPQDRKAEAKELIEGILKLYTELHKHSGIKGIVEKDGKLSLVSKS